MVMAPPAPAQARLESQSAELQQACKAVSTSIGALTAANARALLDLRDCDESSGAVLARLWSVPRNDAAVLQMLVVASANVRDGRIADAALDVVKDTSRSPVDRSAALTVLGNYLNPERIGHVSFEQGTIHVQLAMRSHVPTHHQGSHAFDDSHRTAIITLADQLVKERVSDPLGALARLMVRMPKRR